MVIKYALLSVYDKTGIVALAKIIIQSGYRIISTGGTAKILTENHIPVTPIQEITGNPESFDGRMKTISFQIESGILFDRSNRSHVREAKQLTIPRIDMVICNLYPFEATLDDPKSSESDMIENIDVGGPTMIRAAAKNFKHVLVVVNPDDYQSVSTALEQNQFPLAFRQQLAAKAFGHIAYYDAQIARHFSTAQFPPEYTLPLKISADLRYGDNPDQQAKVYAIPHAVGVANQLQKISGRDLSATNVTDIDAGLKSLFCLEGTAAVVIKHNTPCGIATGSSAKIALDRAIDSDFESAFGGVVVLNKPMTASAAQIIADFKSSGKGQMDIIVAPAFDSEAVSVLTKVRKSTGLYSCGRLNDYSVEPLTFKHISGGMVVQTVNDPTADFSTWSVVTKVKPTPKQMEQMQLAWRCIARIKSNTVIVVDASIPMTRGIGSGQTSRILSTQIALERAGKYAQGGILASDSFFPFDDSVKLASAAGIKAIIQQGGSIHDRDSIAAADQAGIAMIFTNQRLFWH